MKYIVYNTGKNSPSLAERDVIWSILLFGDEVQITSTYSVLIAIGADFMRLSWKEKYGIYYFFKAAIEKDIRWKVFEKELKEIIKLKNKKARTQLDNINLQNKEHWLRQIDVSTMQFVSSNLANFNYLEIAPLIQGRKEEKEPDISVKIAIDGVERIFDSDIEENSVMIVTNALLQTDNLFVFDEKIEAFSSVHPLNRFNSKELTEGDKPLVFSEKVLDVPLCYTLRSNDIDLARNILTQQFKGFHQCIYDMSKDETGLMKELNRLHLLLPVLQQNIDNNPYVMQTRNKMVDLPVVELYLGFTSNRALLTLLHKLGNLDNEQLLQAGEIVNKDMDLNKMRAFMYIRHKQ